MYVDREELEAALASMYEGDLEPREFYELAQWYDGDLAELI